MSLSITIVMQKFALSYQKLKNKIKPYTRSMEMYQTDNVNVRTLTHLKHYLQFLKIREFSKR